MAGVLATTTLPKRMFGKGESVDDGSDLAKPTKAQAAWQDLELGMFIHLGMFSVQPQIMPKTIMIIIIHPRNSIPTRLIRINGWRLRSLLAPNMPF